VGRVHNPGTLWVWASARPSGRSSCCGAEARRQTPCRPRNPKQGAENQWVVTGWPATGWCPASIVGGMGIARQVNTIPGEHGISRHN